MKRIVSTTAILLSLIIGLSSCEFKVYKPFDNAIAAMNAKDSTAKLQKDISERNKSKIDSLKEL